MIVSHIFLRDEMPELYWVLHDQDFSGEPHSSPAHLDMGVPRGISDVR